MQKRTKLPDSVTNHQKSVRVGPPLPVVKNRRGFLLPVMFIIVAGIVYTAAAFFAFLYDTASHTVGTCEVCIQEK